MPSPTFPCPNPTCSQVFAPEAVRGVSSLTCPRCGHVFQFGKSAARPAPPPPAAKPAPAPKPAAKAPPPPPQPKSVPVATPISTKPPVAEPVAEESLSGIFVPPAEPPPSRRGSKSAAARPKGRRSANPWLIPVIVGGLLIAIGVGAWLLRDWWQSRPPAEEPAPSVESKRFNFTFRLPRDQWKDDSAAERELGAQIAMHRNDPNSWFALVIHNYETRMPRDDEMVRETLTRLEKLFKGKPGWEQRGESTFAGLPAQRLVFFADYNNVAVSGECLMIADKGIGYWFFGWTPSAVDVSVMGDVMGEWDTIRQGFRLLKERDGWAGKVPEIVEAEGTKAGYRLRYPKDVWEKDNNPADADLLLLGRDPDKPQDARNRAWVRTFIRPAAGDPEAALKEARAFLETREKELYPKVKMDTVPGESKSGLADGPVDLGGAKGQAVRLHVDQGDEYEHFFAVVAVVRPAYTLVIAGECPWHLHAAWEERFGPVMHSLRFDKK